MYLSNKTSLFRYSLVVVPVESNSSVDELMKPDSFSQYKLIANSNTLRRRRRRQVRLIYPNSCFLKFIAVFAVNI